MSHWPPGFKRPHVPRMNVTGVRESGAETVLEEAARLVHGNRGDDYGHPLDNHTCTSAMFSAFLYRKYGIWVPLDAEDTCVFNVCQKLSREANRPKRENSVDGAGYFENIQMVRDERARRA